MRSILSETGSKLRALEPCYGLGHIGRVYEQRGCIVTPRDLFSPEEKCNMFETPQKVLDAHDIIITNPPFAHKYEALEWAFEMKKPFALLLPFEVIGTL